MHKPLLIVLAVLLSACSSGSNDFPSTGVCSTQGGVDYAKPQIIKEGVVYVPCIVGTYDTE